MTVFDTVIRSLILKNPLGCTSYWNTRKNHLLIMKVRELYTAKFEYLDMKGKRIGSGSDMYDSVEGYNMRIAAVISNIANIVSHRGKVRHMPKKDLFSVTMKCHDPDGGIYFLSIARDRLTLSSYNDKAMRKRVEIWTQSMPVLI